MSLRKAPETRTHAAGNAARTLRRPPYPEELVLGSIESSFPSRSHPQTPLQSVLLNIRCTSPIAEFLGRPTAATAVPRKVCPLQMPELSATTAPPSATASPVHQ